MPSLSVYQDVSYLMFFEGIDWKFLIFSDYPAGREYNKTVFAFAV